MVATALADIWLRRASLGSASTGLRDSGTASPLESFACPKLEMEIR